MISWGEHAARSRKMKNVYSTQLRSTALKIPRRKLENTRNMRIERMNRESNFCYWFWFCYQRGIYLCLELLTTYAVRCCLRSLVNMHGSVNEQSVFQNRISAVGKYRITESYTINNWFMAPYLH
jgi:hypothetical protein